MCRIQVAYIRRGDTFCYACYWDGVLKRLLFPLVGHGRQFMPDQAADPDPNAAPSYEIVRLADFELPKVLAAETDTERWMRTSEAWNAVSDYLLAIVYVADPGNGHGFERASRKRESIG